MISSNEKRIQWVNEYLVNLDLDAELPGYYRGRNVLVTGGAGAIGSNLTLALSELVGSAGKVIILDNLSSIKEKKPWNVVPLNNIMFVEGDVRSDIDLKRVFKEDITHVFHLAAFFANQNSVDYPEISAEVDIIGLIKLLEYSRLARVEKFVYASSGCAIYGSYPQLPLKEDFISMHLTTPYQINKMTGEMYCNFYAHHYEMQTVNCRFFNSYGPGEVPGQYRNVIPNFIFWALSGLPLPFTGSGEETRDFTYVTDIVDALLRAGVDGRAVGQEMNIASGKEIKILKLAERINELTGNKAGIMRAEQRVWDTKKRLLASVDKARELIGYEPSMDFEEGLMSTINWFRENWDHIRRDAEFPPGMSSATRGMVVKK